MTTGNEKPGDKAKLVEAQTNLSEARRLDAVHSLGGATLEALVRQNTSIDQYLDTDAIPLGEILQSDDMDMLAEELKRRADQSLAIIGDVGGSDILGYASEHISERVKGAVGKDWKNIFGDVLVVHRNFDLTVREKPSIFVQGVYLVGSHAHGDREITFPNPSLHVLRLDPHVVDDELEWTGPWDTDVENLGQSANAYFNPATFDGPFARAIGHARAYRVNNFGRLSYEIPESGNPSEIQPGDPRTELDVLVKRAIEGFQIQERMLELKVQSLAALEWQVPA